MSPFTLKKQIAVFSVGFPSGIRTLDPLQVGESSATALQRTNARVEWLWASNKCKLCCFLWLLRQGAEGSFAQEVRLAISYT